MGTDIGPRLGAAILSPALMGSARTLNSVHRGLSKVTDHFKTP